MVTLADARPEDFALDIGGIGRQFQQGRQQTQLKEAQQQLFQPGASREQVTDSLLTIGRLNPQLGQFALSVFERGDALEIKKVQNKIKREAARAQALKNIKDPKKRRLALLDMASEMGLTGEDPTEILKMVDMSPDELALDLDTDILIGEAFGTVFKEKKQFQLAVGADGQVVQVDETGRQFPIPQQPAANTTIGKARQDLRTGKITTKEFEVILDKEKTAATQGRFTKAPGVVVQLPDGGFAQSIPVLNEKTGVLENKVVPIEGQPVSRLGQTAEETAALRVQTAGRTAGATREVERVTAAPIAAERKRGGAEETRAQGNITGALLAADGLPQLQRSLKLLDEVKTGGFAAVQFKVKRLFGIESADEGELSFNLSKNVMKQLKPTFGAAFTEREGALLAAIEAGLGKSPEANKRLLRQAIKIYRTAIERGQRAALNRGDQEALRDISEAMSVDLSPEGLAAEPTGAPTTPPQGFQGSGAAGPGQMNFNPETGRLEPSR